MFSAPKPQVVYRDAPVAPKKTDAELNSDAEAETRRRGYSVNGFTSLYTGAGVGDLSDEEEKKPKKVSLGT